MPHLARPPHARGANQQTAAIVSRSLFGGSDASNASSDLGTVNCEKPQSKQTKAFWNINTLGLSRFLRPLRWTIISKENSTCLTEAHIAQDITLPRSYKNAKTQFNRSVSVV